MLALLGLVFVAACSQLQETRSVVALGCGFVLARSLSGLSLVWFPAARKNGSLYVVAEAASRTIIRVGLTFMIVVCTVVLLLCGWSYAVICFICAGGSFLWYWIKSAREFGGITGDVAGCFVCVCECVIAIGLAVLEQGV